MNPCTSSTLLQRVRVHGNHRAWQEFFALYQPLVRAFALKMGVDHAEVDDVEQEVFLTISKEMPGFEYTRTCGKFSSWVYQVTRHRVLMAFRKRKTSVFQDDFEEPHDDAEVWREMFSRQVFEEACRRVRSDVQPYTWEAFWRLVVKGESVSEVAQTLQKTVGSLYVAKSRVAARIREQMTNLDA